MSQNFEASVLFICWGNICRSPTAEGVMMDLVVKRGLEERVHVDSAGTLSYHVGEQADPRMRATAAMRGYDLRSISRQITREDFDDFTLVVVMDHKNLNDLEELFGQRENVRMLGEFLPGIESANDAPEVPDPYFGGDQGFERVLDLIEDACPRLLDELIGESSS